MVGVVELTSGFPVVLLLLFDHLIFVPQRERLVLFDGMGHDLPEGLWDDLVGELTKTFSDAQ